MSGRKWGYGPNGERETFPLDADLPEGWAETPAVFWTDEERAGPEWPEWYVEAMRLYDEGPPTSVPSVPAPDESVKRKPGRPPKAKT